MRLCEDIRRLYVVSAFRRTRVLSRLQADQRPEPVSDYNPTASARSQLRGRCPGPHVMAFASRVGLVVLATVVFGVSATLQDGGTTVANVSRALGARQVPPKELAADL